MDAAQTLGVPGFQDAVPVPQVPLGACLHSSFLYHGVIVAVHLVPAGNGLAAAQGELVGGDAQQAADVLFPAPAQGQQLEVGVGLLAGLHALGAPNLQLMHHGSHGALAAAGHIGHAQHHGLRRKTLLHIQVHQLFHLAVGQRAGKAGLGAVDQAGDHGVGAAGGGDLGPGHGGGGTGLGTRGRVFLVAFQQPGTGPEGQGTFGADAAAQLEVCADLVRVGDAGGQYIQSHPDVVFFGDAQLGKYQLRHRDGIALEFFQTVDHAFLVSASSSGSGAGGVQGSQSIMSGQFFQRSGSALKAFSRQLAAAARPSSVSGKISCRRRAGSVISSVQGSGQ